MTNETTTPAAEVAAEAAPGVPGYVGTHYPDDTTTVLGRQVNLPVYTVVFIALGILTVLEVALAELVPRGGLTIPLMLIISLGKAALVVWFYMHLNSDSRLFAITLLVPVVMVTLATLFLMIVPVGY